MAEPKKILITGANGLLGQKVTEIFQREGQHELVLTDLHDKSADSKNIEYFQMDITVKDDVKEAVRKHAPNIIVNTAAYTNVDGCETEKEHSWRVNVDAVKNFIIAARLKESKIIHISTDYVFDGKSGNYDESSKPNPLSSYGKRKLSKKKTINFTGNKIFNCEGT